MTDYIYRSIWVPFFGKSRGAENIEIQIMAYSYSSNKLERTALKIGNIGAVLRQKHQPRTKTYKTGNRPHFVLGLRGGGFGLSVFFLFKSFSSHLKASHLAPRLRHQVTHEQFITWMFGCDEAPPAPVRRPSRPASASAAETKRPSRPQILETKRRWGGGAE